MNVLVLGSDPRHELILNSLTAVAGHSVERFHNGGMQAPGVDVDDFQALICAGPVRSLVGQIRQFLSAGKPVMVIPSAAQGSDAAYELLAIEEESGGALMAAFPHRFARLWRELRGRLADLQFIQIERRLQTTGEAVVSYAEVDELLLGDADLLRWLGADCTEVTCLYVGATEEGVSRATVTLAGDPQAEATWVLETHAAGEECRLSVTAAGATFSVGEADGVSLIAADCAAGLLADLQRAADGQTPEATWMDAVRAFDVVDAARRSVKRRRTVEIAGGEVSERGQFKTKMTALGCSLLSFTLVGVVLALLVGAVFDPRDAMQRQSEAAGLVLERDSFLPGRPELTGQTRTRLEDPSLRLRETAAAIIVEAEGSDADPALDEERRAAVVEFLQEQRGLDLESRVVVRPLAGRGFQRFMTGLWIVVFLPLGVFLIMQALIIVTRAPESPGEADRSG